MITVSVIKELTSLKFTRILCSFRVVLVGQRGKTPESEDSNSGPLNTGGIGDMPLLREIRQQPRAQLSAVLINFIRIFPEKTECKAILEIWKSIRQIFHRQRFFSFSTIILSTAGI